MSGNTNAAPKTIGILSYLWLPGWVIAFIFHNQQPSALGAFHLRQALGIMLLGVGVWMINLLAGITSGINPGWVLSLWVFVLWLIGLIGASKEEQNPIPLFGEQFQRLFKEVIKDQHSI